MLRRFVVMSEVLSGRRGEAFEDGKGGLSVVDVDVHEMLNSVKDLAPHLEEPWRSRIEVNDGFKGPPGNPYSFPQPEGVAIQDAVTDDGSPAGSKLEMLQEQVLDRYGIEPAVLISLFHPTDHQIQPEFATALASAYNDWVLENWLEKDDRLRSSITVAAQEPRDAAREIDRLGSDPRFVQVILPAVAHHVFGRPYYWPIFEAAQRNDLVVAFHQSGGTRTAVGLPPYYIEWHTAISQNWQSQLISLIAGGVFDEFEELKVAMVESSWTWVPHLMWRFDYNYRSLRREVPWVKRLPSEYIRERVRFSTQPMEYPEDPEDLYRMFEMIGSDEFLMFATDYPHWDFDSPEQALPRSFPKELRRKILSGNAREFYGF
jgi:uncharacterized protein